MVWIKLNTNNFDIFSVYSNLTKNAKKTLTYNYILPLGLKGCIPSWS